MSNEIKITGLVPAEEMKAMKDLMNLFNETKKAYSTLADKLAGGLNIKPTSLQELKLKAEDATKVMREMAETQNQLAKIQEDYKKLVLQLNEATKKRTATIVEEAKANDLNAAASLKTEKAETQRLKNQKNITQEANKRKVSIEEMIKLLDFESDSYYEINRAMLALEKGYKSLSKAQRDSEFGAKTVSKIQLLKDELKTLDSGMGNYQRNVGNYASHWNGLSNAVNQVVREVPSAAISLNTFFLAISNNLPILADEIKKVKIENDALRRSGEKTVPLWKTITGSIFSWQSAMIIAITVLSMYGKQIFEWVGNLINVKEKIDETAEAQKRLNEAKRQGVIDSIKETSSLRLLYKAATDVSRSTEERAFAVKELKSLFPEYFSFLKDETIKAGEAADVYYLLTERIKASARARRIESLLIDNIEKQNKLIGETALKTIEAKKAQEEYNIALEIEKSSLIGSDDITRNRVDAGLKLLRANNELTESQKKLREQTINNLKVEKAINVIPLFGDPNKIDDASKRNEAFWRHQRTVSESALKQMESSVKSTLDKASSGNKDLYSLGIDKSVVDAYKSNIEKINEANENLRVYDFSVNANNRLEAEKERHADYMRRIDNELSKASASTIEQEKEHEIEVIQAKFKEKESKIKGYSEKEKELRKAYSEAMEKDIAEIEYKYATQIEQKTISDKLEAVEKGSKEEYDLKVKQLELLRDVEITEATKTGYDSLSIEEKYNAKRTELLEKFSSEKAKKIEEGSAVQSIILNQQMQSELDVLTESYSKGLVDKEAYEREKAEIAEKYAIKQAQLAITVAKAQLAVGNFSPEDRMAFEKKIADAEIALSATVRDAKISDIDRTAKEREEDMNKLMGNIQMAGDFLNAFSDLGASLFEGRIQKIEEEQDALDESKEAELEKIQKLEESGAISKEEAEARKRAAEDKTAQKDKELAKKKADLQTKQAKMDKANNIMQAIMNTSLAIIKQSAATPLPLGLPFIAAISALGAVQLAAIIAQPIPKYREGTKDHPGGLAVVGDGGRSEAIITPSGDSFITPDIATMVDIPKHSMVIPNLVDYVKQITLQSDLGLTMRNAEMKGEPININVSNDFKSIERKLDKMADSFDNLAKYQRKASVEAELNYLKSRL